MPLSDFEYNEDVGTITRVTFGILSPERIKQKAVCEIYKHITNSNHKEGTLADPRLGTIERNIICPTCGQTYKECPGHYGYHMLAKPVIQIQYYHDIIKILKCFCNQCSAIRFNKYDVEALVELKSRKGKSRFLYVSEKAKSIKTCLNCGAAQPEWKRDKDGIAKVAKIDRIGKIPVIHTLEGDKKEKLIETVDPEIILKIFKKISDEDVDYIGLNPKLSRPDWMIWTIMLIPPPQMRPSVKSETGKVSDDDISHKLNDIIKFNTQLRIKLEEPTKKNYIDVWWQLLQYHVATYVDNEISNIPKATHRSGRPLKTIRQRVKTKDGRVRGNLMGKRVDGSARSVITADPNLSLDELGVPKQIAMNLTYPEKVTIYNISQLTQYVRNGPDVYPGAKSYKKKGKKENKKSLRLESNRENIKLQPGDIVYRHLIDGDWVLFNRQPSLHKMSMMGHRVRVLPWKTFRLNVNVTSPYNADFDGDEMNMHIPQSYEAINELRFLAAVPYQIVSPQASAPVMGLVQDSLLGSNLLTSDGVTLNLQQMMRLIGWINCYDGKIPRPMAGNLWTSQQLVSLFLPNISFKEDTVEIVGGDMRSGVLGKDTLGAKNNSLFHITWNDHGPSATQDLFNNISNVAKEWLLYRGFSTGISDCVTTPEVNQSVKKIIRETKEKAIREIEKVNLGTSEKISDPQTIKAEFPSHMITLLNDGRREAENLTYDQLNKNNSNSINTMVKAGSKGNKTNIVQVVSLLGQQEVEGSWIPEQYYRRTLPHFHKDNLSPEAHGFVENSFMDGLTPTEYWFHAQAGRVGVISRAIKTAETGYIQRKLIKAMEDLRVCYDGTVRNANNIIIQTVYGNDGFDTLFHESQKIGFLNYNMTKLQKQYKHLLNENESLRQILTVSAYKEYQQHKNNEKELQDEFDQILEYYSYLKTNVFSTMIPSTVKCPVNFNRLILRVTSQFNLKGNLLADIDPVYIVKQVRDLRRQIVVTRDAKQDPDSHINKLSTIIFNSLLSTNLSSKNLIYYHRFNKVAFDFLLKEIYLGFLKSLINPGEAVGVISAQSIGEPCTQLTLDTFHNTGVGSKANVSRGVPRIRELMSLSRNPKTPSLTVQIEDRYFDELRRKNKDLEIEKLTIKACLDADKLAAEMEYTTLEDLLVRAEIYYDENDNKTCIIEDQEFIDSYYALLPKTEISNIPWLLRLEFNRESIMNKHIPMSLIEYKLRNALASNEIEHSVIVSDDNACKLICRIKIKKNTLSAGQDPITYLRLVEKNLMNVVIKGIYGISKGIVRPEKKDIILDDGTIISPFDTEYDAYSLTHEHLSYLIDTNGSNLIDVLNLPNIDIFNTVSNNVWEMYEVYGIEVARACFIYEFNAVLEYNSTYIAPRHIDLLADVMTNQGHLVSVDRHGVNKTDSGPLHRASFEETTTQITNASIYNEVDYMTGVSGNIMFGQFVPVGTNSFRLALDLDMIKNFVPPSQSTDKKKAEISVATLGEISDECNHTNFQFSFKMNTDLPDSTIF
jgi:DNA-directed RNA polymerase II subunit RPB1